MVDFPWWSEIDSQQGFEEWIESFLPSLEPWSDMRQWGFEHGNRVSVCYVEGGSTKVEEIGITIDARHAPEELLEKLGDLASKLRCVFLTVHTAEIVQPDKPSLLQALKESTANRFLDDPETTLKGLNCNVFEIDTEPKN